jgi:hypothetical protein
MLNIKYPLESFGSFSLPLFLFLYVDLCILFDVQRVILPIYIYMYSQDNVIFIQIAVPTRQDVFEYKQLKREVDQLVGRFRFSFLN